MKIGEALNWAGEKLAENEVKGPKSSARLILSQVIGAGLAYIYANLDKELTLKQGLKFRRYIKRRAHHEPVWYILNDGVEFYGNNYYVDKRVLIPRPETEFILEKIIKEQGLAKNARKVLDIGTGSGAGIITLANNLGDKNEYFASDVSSGALAVAKKNIKKNTEKAITLKKGNLFAPWGKQKFDLIFTNLPYIPSEDLPYLDKDVRQYEPLGALDGGEKGLEIYKEFFRQVPEYLKKGGTIYCEIGHNQGDNVAKLGQEAFPKSEVGMIRDLAGKDRLVVVRT